jgi:hypothetical protein
VRVLAIYYDLAELDVPRCLQYDVSREQGIWSVLQLLASGQVAEVRFVGETVSSVRLVRTLVRAGRYRRPSGHARSVLWVPGDEGYPFPDPFIFIRPEPEPAAFV